ncbi:MAG: OmcA/MtrC family decaheme c-type cytochrome [Thermoanaerobaculia bacterium]
MSLVSRTALTFLAGLVAVPMTPLTHTGPSGSPVAREATPVAYDATQKEFFLSPDQITYIRPGLNVKLGSVTNVAPGQKPVIEAFITDNLGIPLDRLGGLTPGPVAIRAVIGSWDASTRRYNNLIIASGAPSRDTTGTFTDLETGHFKYTFSNALPTFDTTKPVTIAVLGRRTTTDIVGKDYWATPVYFDIIPSTGAPATTFTATVVAKCNQCHDPIAPHGGNYRDIKTCVLCHNPNNMTGDRTHFDGEIFFHALHQGKDSTIGSITYPQDIRNCATCHDAKSAGGGSWYTYPSIAACGSCHNDLNFVTGANHAAGPAADGTCATCHQPQGNVEWDAGIKNAHVVPLHSAQLKGFNAKILSVTNTKPGQNPVVTFQLTNGDGSFVDPGYFKVSANGSLNILLGGNTLDYGDPALVNGQPFREAAQNATYNATNGQAVYTFTNAIPATATGTWTASIETRRTVALSPAPTKGPATENEGAPNQPFNIAVTDATPTPRRTLVALANCNVCHQDLQVLFSHGNQRITIEHCVICHNPNADDRPFRPAAQAPAESVSFARLIHRIHSGDTLDQNFTVYGFGGNASVFNDVTYPGDRRNCLACHTSAAVYTLPLPITNTPVVTLRDFFSPRGSATSACTGCHDSRDVAAHAFLNTAYFPGAPTVPAEACGTCHGAGATYAVDVVHAR